MTEKAKATPEQIAKLKATPAYHAAVAQFATAVEGDACTTADGRSGYVMACGRGLVFIA